MKIGEAGEAFFVFETDAEVPQDLITSPILEATKPGQSNAQAASAVQGGRFGAPTSPSDVPELDLDASATTPDSDLEPEQQNMNGDSGAEEGSRRGGVLQALNPVSLVTGTVTLGKAVAHAAVEASREEKDQLQDRLNAARNVQQHLRDSSITGVHKNRVDNKGDEALPDTDINDIQPVEVVDAGGTYDLT
jgi:phosphatidate phosphatase LPIN